MTDPVIIDHERRIGALESQNTLRDSQVSRLASDMSELKAATGEQTVILHKVSGGITALKWVGGALVVLVPAAWALWLHFHGIH